MSTTINSDTLKRLLEAESAHNATLVQIPYRMINNSSTVAILTGTIVLLTISLIVLGGWVLLFWIGRVESRGEGSKGDDEEKDGGLEAFEGKMN